MKMRRIELKLYFIFKLLGDYILPIVFFIVFFLILFIVYIKSCKESTKNAKVRKISEDFHNSYKKNNLGKYDFFGTYKGDTSKSIDFTSGEKYTCVEVSLQYDKSLKGYFKQDCSGLVKNKSEVGCYLDNRRAVDGNYYYVFEKLNKED